MKNLLFILSTVALLFGCSQQVKEEEDPEAYLNVPEIVLTPLQQRVHDQINEDWQTGMRTVKLDSILASYVDSLFIIKVDSMNWKGQSNTHERIRREYRYETFKIGAVYDFLIDMDNSSMGLMLAKDYHNLSYMQSIEKYYQRMLDVLEGEQKERFMKNQQLWRESLQSDIEFSREMIGEHGSASLYADYTDRRHRLRFIYSCYEDAYIDYLLEQDIPL